ncbi:MAG: tRNA lysidine(34) synthetase TilS [Actinomycetota bacterium]
MSALRDALFTSSLASGMLARSTFPSNDHLHCAVSGGADSLVLLMLACRTERPVTAWHVDHGLRENTANEHHFVRQVAESLDATVELRTVHIGPGANLEARAREARFAALPGDVLTGHTADDQAETTLINLLRGAGTAGLAGMRRDRHPLLGLRRSETRELCAALGVVPLHDPMNDESRFQRVRVREELMPLLIDISKRDIVDVLVRQAELLRDDDDLLDELAAMIDVTDARALSAVPIALARRAVRQWLANPLPPDASTIERVLAVARGDAAGCDVGAGRQVRRSRQRLGLHDNRVL